MTVAEVDPFPAKVRALLNEAECSELIAYVARFPESGVVIPDTGGLRKLRWYAKGSGKRGGLRVIYYFYDEGWPVFLLSVYRKSQQEDLNSEQKKRLRSFVEILKKEMRARGPRRR